MTERTKSVGTEHRTVSNQTVYDLAVVGGGIGGLALAALAQQAGLRTVLFESHKRLGGCAGYFDRGDYTFDCGATALMGLEPGQPLHGLLDRIGMELKVVRTPEYRMCLPDGDLIMTADDDQWHQAIRTRFPELGESAVRFWKIQKRLGAVLFEAGSKLPRLPIRTIGDIVHDLRILGMTGTIASLGTLVTVRDLLRIMGLNGDRRFRSIIAMLLQDSAQAGPDLVPLTNAAAYLHAYRLGLSRPRGGMKAFAEGIGNAFNDAGGKLHRSTIIDSVDRQAGADQRFHLTTRRGQTFSARHVAMNLPIDRCAALLGRDSNSGPLKWPEARSRPGWSAFMAYAVVDAEAVATHQALFHHVLQDYSRPIHDGNNVLISLSPENDRRYAPKSKRVITMSTHVKPEPWFEAEGAEYENLKKEYGMNMMYALTHAFPGVEPAIRHIEYATPRSFARYTRRTLGRVGGPPVSRSRSNLRAVDPGVLGPGLWVIGDSVFPGQGTMAVVMCAMRVLERITGCRWNETVSAHSTESASVHV
jgi:C-3',4' desaturase CrtD